MMYERRYFPLLTQVIVGGVVDKSKQSSEEDNIKKPIGQPFQNPHDDYSLLANNERALVSKVLAHAG